jgi:hypothetical protein
MSEEKKQWHEALGLRSTNLKNFYTRPALTEKFNPLTASQDQLLQSGFPVRPDPKTDGEANFRWLSLYGRAFNYIHPELLTVDGRTHGPLGENAPSSGSATSSHWAGNAVIANAGTSFTGISGVWTIPGISAPRNGPYIDAGLWTTATWVGLDGAGISGDVFQAGVEQDLTQGGLALNQTNYYAWIEWFPAPTIQISNFAVSPGDSMSVTLQILPPQIGVFRVNYSVGQALLINQTTGDFTTIVITGPAISSQNPAQFLGNSAEWILETPCLSNCSNPSQGNYGPLPFIGGIAFTSANAWDSFGNGSPGINGTTFRMDNSGNGNGRNGGASGTGTLVTVAQNAFAVITLGEGGASGLVI